MKTDEEYRAELKKLVNDNVISICAKISKHSIDTVDLEKWIFMKTAFLEKVYKEKQLSLSTRIFYALNDINTPLKCKKNGCNELLGH